MTVTAYQSRGGIIILPSPTGRPICSLKINGTEYKEDALNFEVNGQITQGVDTASVDIKNFSGQNNTAFSKGNIMEIYCDNEDGTTQIFGGKIISVDPKNLPVRITLNAMDYGYDAFGEEVYGTYTGTTSAIFQQLIGLKLPAHTVTNVESETTVITISWDGKKLWQCLQDLAEKTGNTWAFYCGYDKDWHYFQKSTKTLTSEVLAYNRNIKQIKLTDSLENIKKRITLYGNPVEGLPLFATIETGYGEGAENLILKDTNLITLEQINARLLALKAIYSGQNNKKGSGVAIGMPTIQKGYKIYIFHPIAGIQGYFTITSYKHTLKSSKFETSFTFQENVCDIKDLTSFLSNTLTTEQSLSNYSNPLDMENSIHLTFKDSTNIGSNSTTVEAKDNYLQLTTGATSGIFYSIAKPISPSATKSIGFRVVGEALTGIEWGMSFDGITYWLAYPDSVYNVLSTTTQVYIGASISNSSTRIKAISIEFK